ncbi:MAG: hypothetical protein ACLTMP_04200 [Eggerthella lenta]
MGYQYFYIIWALWALLRKLDKPVASFASLSMMMLVTASWPARPSAQLVLLADGPYTMAVVAACSVFVILLVSLFTLKALSRIRMEHVRSAWRMGKPRGSGARSEASSREVSPRVDPRLLAKGHAAASSAQLVSRRNGEEHQAYLPQVRRALPRRFPDRARQRDTEPCKHAGSRAKARRRGMAG